MAIIERLLGERPSGVSGPTMRRAGRADADVELTPVGSEALPGDRTFAAASDAQLAIALGNLELPALDEAFRRHATQVADAVRRTAGGYHVDDVVQEVFLSLWRAPERFQPALGSLGPYLVMVARTKTIDAVRSDDAWRRRHVRHGSQLSEVGGVEDTVMASVSATELRMALRALPMTERVAIELAFFGGYTYREVATQLSEPEGTIKSRIRSGLRRLETALRRLGAAELE